MGNVQSINNKGNALKAQGDPKGAIECFNQAIKINPNDATAHNNKENTIKNLITLIR